MNTKLKKAAESKNRALTTFCFSALFLIFAISVFGSFRGPASPDESFYFTIPYRVSLGDALFFDEWHASQISAFPLYLPLKLFIAVTGSTDGIILFFRLLYCVCQCCVSCFIFISLNKKYSTVTALLSAIIFQVYAPETLDTLDYYTMSLMGLAVCSFLLIFIDKPSFPVLFLCGVTFAFTVTAQPFFVILYAVWAFGVLFFLIRKKKSSVFNLNLFIKVSTGILLSFIVFMIWLLSKENFREFLSSFGNIFSGEDHVLPFTQGRKTDMFTWYVIPATLFNANPFLFCLSNAVLVPVIIDRKRTEHRNIYLFISTLVLLIYQISIFITAPLFWPVPAFIFLIIVLVLTQKTDKRLVALTVAGIIYVFIFGIVSQALDYTGATGLVLSLTALFPSAKDLLKEIGEQQQIKNKTPDGKNYNIQVFISKVIRPFICVFLSAALVSGLAYCGYSAFSPDTMAAQFDRPSGKTIQLTDGPLKGIFIQKALAQKYNKMLNDIDTINSNSDGKILIAELIPFLYLASDNAPATDTTWFITEETILLNQYYEADESHIPSVVYIPNDDFYWNGHFRNKIQKNNIRNDIEKMFVYTREQGQAGDIYNIISLR